MENIQIILGELEFTFKVEIVPDLDHGAPWENEDGHGPVSGWTTRDKRPSELVLNTNSGNRRYYDFAKACRIALDEGWDAHPYNDGSESRRQQAAKAARADFEYLKAWCDDKWRYVGVIVTLLDEDGEETEIMDSVWGIDDSDTDYIRECARNMADELAGGYGVSWGEHQRRTFGYLEFA